MSRPTVNRRTFAKSIAKRIAAGSLAAGPLALGAPLVAAEPQKSATPPAPEQPPPPAELILQLLAQFYPRPLDEAQRAEIVRQIAEDQARSKILSGFALTNADEPAPVFAAWRSEG
ncbi:MAG TPA: hypothetical protein VMV10_08985 [Pirellulales bacterium]|nr:hypothetical protein [Pirellulales bacterium]